MKVNKEIMELLFQANYPFEHTMNFNGCKSLAVMKDTTVYEVRDWIYEKHKLWLEVRKKDGLFYARIIIGYMYGQSDHLYPTPTEALQAELPIVLKKLLEEKKEEITEQELTDEILEEALKSYEELDKQETEKQNAVLSEIGKIVSEDLLQDIKRILKEDVFDAHSFTIVEEPEGDYQDEAGFLELKGYWVNQHSVGYTGDDFKGTICIQISENKYFKFDYSS